MKLEVKQKEILIKINAPHVGKDDLNNQELEELCDYISDYVIEKETSNDEVSAFGNELLNLHDDIVP